MLLTGVRNWVGRSAQHGADGLPALSALGVDRPDEAATARSLAALPARAWSPARIAVVESLWGEGFLYPGGEYETLRLVKPLGLSSSATLLLLGAGSGGPAQAIVARLGVRVAAFEADPDLAALATERSAATRFGRRVRTETWRPATPFFPAAFCHHALVLEPLRGAAPEPVLSAVAQALKPAGQIMLLELVAGAEADSRDPLLAAWTRLERRSAELPRETAVTRTLGRLGFEVRKTEDLSARHASYVLRGWQHAVRRLTEDRPPIAEAALLVAEAELWLLRLRLIRTGRLRLVRWHAVGQAG